MSDDIVPCRDAADDLKHPPKQILYLCKCGEVVPVWKQHHSAMPQGAAALEDSDRLCGFEFLDQSTACHCMVQRFGLNWWVFKRFGNNWTTDHPLTEEERDRLLRAVEKQEQPYSWITTMSDDELRNKVAEIVEYNGKHLPNYPSDMNAARDAFMALHARHKQLQLTYCEGMLDWPNDGLSFPEVSIADEDADVDANSVAYRCADKHPARLMCEAIVEAHEKLGRRQRSMTKEKRR